MSTNKFSGADTKKAYAIKVGTYFAHAPYGIAIIVNDATGFLIDPDWECRGGKTPYNERDVALVTPAETAPDYSFVQAELKHEGAAIRFTWGRVGEGAVVGTFETDKAVRLTLRLPATWPHFHAIYKSAPDGITGQGITPGGLYVPFALRVLPQPTEIAARGAGDASVTLALTPDAPTKFVAGVGALPDIEASLKVLKASSDAYQAHRTRAEGDWGDFTGAIAQNMNASRIYSSDNARVAHVVGRGWWIYYQSPIDGNPDLGPYFCWDSFFNGALACLEDPTGARDTVRAVLSLQTPEGMIGNFSHWLFDNQYVSTGRSQPPVAAMCVWKMHERWPDKKFLAEVYTRLVKWHDWWPKYRDGNHNGLLEWGSANGEFWAALLETGWDDTVHFDGAAMRGTAMMADAVDLNALWSTDAENLALIADALGKKVDAKRFRDEHAAMNKRINDLLWNDDLGIYCSRKWNEDGRMGEFLTRLTPMNFYPLMCGAAQGERVTRTLQWLDREDKFKGEWILPTVAFDDPVWHGQNYWRGHVWPPANYLVWQGVMRCAPAALRAEFARKSVLLFMRNWNTKRQCGENYRSDTGDTGNHPHYTWGALLPLIGVEALVGTAKDFTPLPCANTGLAERLVLRNIPFGGKLYSIEARNGKVTVEAEKPD
ncbi:MAG: trehalase family glycosidase [Armatimonadetes bacterium]|nr:trehalase family glycosidase [Armatimonadota bacterium]